MIASVGASVGQWALMVALIPLAVSGLIAVYATLRYDRGRRASRQLDDRLDREVAEILRDAVERAELRRRGVVPLERPDPMRQALEDDLLNIVERTRGGAA